MEELTAIINCSAPHVRRAIILFASTGIRPGPKEGFSLRYSDCDFFRKTITIRAAEKGGPPVRQVPISSSFMAHLLQWREEDKEGGITCGFIIHYHGSMVQSIKKGWGEAKRRAGITRRLRLYDIRHKFATDLLTTIGVDVKTVSKLLGHKSAMTTVQVYQHVEDRHGREAVERLEILGTFDCTQDNLENKK